MDERANLSEIERRAEAATPGPWDADDALPQQLEREGRLIRSPLTAANGKRLYVAATSGDPGAKDAEFIAHSREDVPALVALVRQLGDALQTIAGDYHAEQPPVWPDSACEALYAFRAASGLGEQG